MMEYRSLAAGGGALEIELEFATPVARAFQGELVAKAALLDRFFLGGGILRTPPGAAIMARVTAAADTTTFTYSKWDLGSEGLGVILRVLRQACAGIGVVKVSVAATEDAIVDLRDAIDEVPSRDPEPPFVLEIEPTDKWVNLEVEFERELTSGEHQELQRLMHLWAGVGSLGGFDMTNLLADLGAEPSEVSIAMAGQAMGADFAQWQFAILGDQFGAVNSLVNLLATFARQTAPLTLVHIA